MTGMDVPWKFLPSICVCAEKLARSARGVLLRLLSLEVLHEWPKMSCVDASIHKIKSGYT